MLEDVTARLLSFGYTVAETDSWVINFLIEKVEAHIKNSCNVSDVPDGLHDVAVDMVCGEFLYKALAEGVVNVEAAVQQIKEGDTSVNFTAGTSPKEMLTSYINAMRSPDTDFAQYRRLRW